MNKKLILKITSLILLLVAFLYNSYSVLRFILVLFGIGLYVYSRNLENKKLVLAILEFIGLLAITFGIDFLLVYLTSYVPIYSYEVKSSNTVYTYNSFYYRVYDCNGKKTFDLGYKKNYACDSTLNEVNINSLLSDVSQNFNKYHNKFVNVSGKISAINGSSNISMQTYESVDSSINGQVLFSENVTLIIKTNTAYEKIDDLKIYDNVNIIGRISKIKNNGQNKEIIMEDAIIISRNNFDSYEINVVQNKKCEVDLKLMSKTDEYDYYSSCLDSIYVVYDEDNRYDLSYVLTDKRMTFDSLISSATKTSSDTGDLYEYENFNILKCSNSNNVIIGNKDLNLKSNYCENFTYETIDEETDGIS
jgi:hypothetical protein